MSRDMSLRVFVYSIMIAFFVVPIALSADGFTAYNVCIYSVNFSCVLILSSETTQTKIVDTHRNIESVLIFMILAPPVGIIGLGVVYFFNFIASRKRDD